MSLARAIANFGHESRCLALVLGRAARGLPGAPPGSVIGQLGTLALSALPLVGIASLFAGMVIALQTSVQLSRLGSGYLVADVVSVSLVRELGPIFTALLMAGKAGAGLASELGMVVLSGQAQAMRALSIDIDEELVAPRVFAVISGTFLLTMAAILLGLLGGMILGAAQVGISPVHYLNRAIDALAPIDFAVGLIKSVGFGVIIAALGCTWGLKAKKDASELGRHTMNAVVLASFTVLVSDYIMTSLIEAVLG